MKTYREFVTEAKRSPLPDVKTYADVREYIKKELKDFPAAMKVALDIDNKVASKTWERFGYHVYDAALKEKGWTPRKNKEEIGDLPDRIQKLQKDVNKLNNIVKKIRAAEAAASETPEDRAKEAQVKRISRHLSSNRIRMR